MTGAHGATGNVFGIHFRPGCPHTRLIHMHKFVSIGLHGSDNKITNKWQMANGGTRSGSINIHIVHHLKYTLATRSAYRQTSYMRTIARSHLLRPGASEQQLSWKHPHFLFHSFPHLFHSVSNIFHWNVSFLFLREFWIEKIVIYFPN